MDNLLRKIRTELGAADSLDDEKAIDVISDVVISNCSEELELKDLVELVEKYFLKTRKKLGVLTPLVENPDISEIMVNGKNDVFVEEKGKLYKTNLTFDSAEELEDLIRYIAGQVHREINEMNPIVDARLKDGSRINGVYKNIALNGPILTIRKFKQSDIDMKKLVELNTLSEECSAFLKELVEARYNIFISGGTSSGKTTFLNALADWIPNNDRVVVIEDSAELQLSKIENIVHLECRNANSMGKGEIDMADLIKTSLRMRPDRIVIGEVRGKEVSDMLQALNTGHDGSMSTGHGNSVTGMLRRLESMYLMGSNMPLESVAGQIIEGIDVIVHLGRTGDGRRKVLQIAEIVDYKDGNYIINDLFVMGKEGLLIRTDNDFRKQDKLNLRRKFYEN